MSDHLHPTRLEWDGRRGVARHDGVQIELREPPSKQWHEVHYVPGIQAEVRERACDPKRDLVPKEIDGINRWLQYMASAGRKNIGHVGEVAFITAGMPTP